MVRIFVVDGILLRGLREKVEPFTDENNNFYLLAEDFVKKEKEIEVRNGKILEAKSFNETEITIPYLAVGKGAIKDELERVLLKDGKIAIVKVLEEFTNSCYICGAGTTHKKAEIVKVVENPNNDEKFKEGNIITFCKACGDYFISEDQPKSGENDGEDSQ